MKIPFTATFTLLLILIFILLSYVIFSFYDKKIVLEGLQNQEVVGITNPRKLPVVPINNITKDTESNPTSFELTGIKDFDFNKSYHFTYDISITRPDKNTNVTNLYPCLIDDDTNKPLVFKGKYVYLLSNHENLLHLYFDGYNNETNPINHLSFYCDKKDFSTIGTANTSSFRFINIKGVDFHKRYMLSLDAKIKDEIIIESNQDILQVNNNPVFLSKNYRKSENTTFDTVLPFNIYTETADIPPIEIEFEYNAVKELTPMESLAKDLEKNKRIVAELKGNAVVTGNTVPQST